MAAGQSILVAADSRDIPLYELLLARGYRLLGYPVSRALSASRRGVSMEAYDFFRDVPGHLQERGQAVFSLMLEGLLGPLNDPDYAAFLASARTSPTHGDIAFDVVRSYLEANLRRIGPAAAITVEAFDRFLDETPVDLLLVKDENAHPDKAMVLQARARGIRTLYVNHGMPWSPTIDTTVYSDAAAVFGPWTRDWYVGNGVDPAKISVTGNMVWDGYAQVTELIDQEAMRVSLELDPSVPAVMYATTICGGNRAADLAYWDWPWQQFLAGVRALASVHRKTPLQLIVKIHPSDRSPGTAQRHLAAARDAGLPTIALTGWADARHVHACDLVMCSDSTIGIEAMLLNRPVVNLQLGGTFPDYLFGADDAVLNVNEDVEIADTVEAALLDPATRRALAARRAESLYRFNYLNDGRAVLRVASLIERLLRGAFRPDAVPLTGAMSPSDQRTVCVEHLQQAESALQSADHDRAICLATQAAQLAPDSTLGAQAALLWGLALHLNGAHEAALPHLQAAVAAAPDDIVARNALAGALFDLGRVLDAQEQVRAALRADADHLDTLANLAEIGIAIGQVEEALGYLRRAAERAPDDPHLADLIRRAGGEAGPQGGQ